jgi:hypothetical protein
MTRRGEIKEVGQRYHFGTFGPMVMKSSCRGRAFTHLRENPGRRVSRKELTEVSGWGEDIVESKMKELAAMVNNWTYYHIETTGNGSKNKYEMTENH